jgi:hypothetical protein
VDADPFRVEICLPTDFAMPAGGLNARLSTDTLGVQARKQEALMQDYKIYAALAYARANKLNRVMIDSPRARLGIIASGKSYLDVLEACPNWASTKPLPPRSGCASSRSPCPGRWSRMACVNSRRASMKSWWWKKSARWSNTS